MLLLLLMFLLLLLLLLSSLGGLILWCELDRGIEYFERLGEGSELFVLFVWVFEEVWVCGRLARVSRSRWVVLKTRFLREFLFRFLDTFILSITIPNLNF